MFLWSKVRKINYRFLCQNIGFMIYNSPKRLGFQNKFGTSLWGLHYWRPPFILIDIVIGISRIVIVIIIASAYFKNLQITIA